MRKTILYVWLTLVIVQGGTFLSQIYLSTILSKEDFGYFGTFISVANIGTILVVFGLNELMLRINREGLVISKPSFVTFIKITNVNYITILVVSIIVYIINPQKEIIYYSIASMILLASARILLLQSINQILNDYKSYNFLQLLAGAVKILPILFFSLIVIFEDSLKRNSELLYFIYLVNSLLIILYVNKKINIITFPSSLSKFDTLKLYSLTKDFFVANASHVIYFYGLSLIILVYLSANSAAEYYAAFLILSVFYTIPAVIFQKVYIRKLHNWSISKDFKFLIDYLKHSIIVVGLSLIIMILLMYFSNHLISIIYGSNYISTTDVLITLSICIPLRFYSSAVGALLMLDDLIIIKSRIMMFVAIVSIISAIALIIEFGLIGAAYSMIVSEVLLALLYSVYGIIKYEKLFNEDERI